MVQITASRAAELVINAIKYLNEEHGSTTKTISEYIAAEHDIPLDVVKRAVTTSLRRGVAFGVITKYRGGFYSLTEFAGFEHTKQRRKKNKRKSKSQSQSNLQTIHNESYKKSEQQLPSENLDEDRESIDN